MDSHSLLRVPVLLLVIAAALATLLIFGPSSLSQAARRSSTLLVVGVQQSTVDNHLGPCTSSVEAKHSNRAGAVVEAGDFYLLSEFTDGDCCEGATIRSTASREAVCRFRRPRSLLVRQPPPRPEKFGDTCLAHAEDISVTPPAFGVLLNVFNTAGKLRLVLTQLIKLTRGPWELIVLFDMCEDDSYGVAMGVLERMKSWPPCNYNITEDDERRVWVAGVNQTSSQGDIGRECLLQPSSLVSVRFINSTKVGLHATAADNAKMLASRSPIFALVDDDQLMTVEGWNLKAAYPLLKWNDVFSASMRCAHGHPQAVKMHGFKCSNTLVQVPLVPADRCAFFVADSGNRGPLILRAAYVQQLGYLDEVMFAGHITANCDHDLNYRAYHQKGWVSGFIPVDFTEDRSRGSNITGGALSSALKQLNQEYVQWFKQHRPQPNWTGASNTHDQTRPIRDSTWHRLC